MVNKLLLTNLSFVFSSLVCVISMSFEMWFYISANLSNLSTQQIDYSDIIMGLMISEFFWLFDSGIGLFFITMNKISLFMVYVLITSCILIIKVFAVIVFYCRDENVLFFETYNYLKSTGIPEKFIAWRTVYYNTGISCLLEILFLFCGICLVYCINFRKLRVGNENLFVEISTSINTERIN